MVEVECRGRHPVAVEEDPEAERDPGRAQGAGLDPYVVGAHREEELHHRRGAGPPRNASPSHVPQRGSRLAMHLAQGLDLRQPHRPRASPKRTQPQGPPVRARRGSGDRDVVKQQLVRRRMTDQPILPPQQRLDLAVQRQICPIGYDDHLESVSGVGLPSDHALHTREGDAPVVWQDYDDRHLRLGGRRGIPERGGNRVPGLEWGSGPLGVPPTRLQFGQRVTIPGEGHHGEVAIHRALGAGEQGLQCRQGLSRVVAMGHANLQGIPHSTGTTQRGQTENFTKDLKRGFGPQGVPCGGTWANAVWCRLGVIAYSMVIGFKRLACPTAWGRHTIATLRWRLVQVAGRIVRHAGQVVLKLVIEAGMLALFQGIRRQCWALRGVT